jgi:hypothetical protein
VLNPRSFRLLFTPAVLVIGSLIGNSFATQNTNAGQNQQGSHIEIPMVEPRNEDVATIDGIVRASYETMAGPTGQKRQWGRDRTLYIKNAYFVETGVNPTTKKPYMKGMTYQEYADNIGPTLEKNGFFEHELGRSVRVFGHVASVTSAWETRTELKGRVTGRGINSIQLVNDGERWWITSINWDSETPENPIPKELMTGLSEAGPN